MYSIHLYFPVLYYNTFMNITVYSYFYGQFFIFFRHYYMNECVLFTAMQNCSIELQSLC